MRHTLVTISLMISSVLGGCGSPSTPKPQERQVWRLDQSAPEQPGSRTAKVEMRLPHPATTPQPSRLPDPPSGSSTGATPPLPPTAASPPTVESSPSTPTPPAQLTPPPFEFHVQFSVQEHLPAARGLAGTIRIPQGLPIFENQVRIVYEWRVEDGKEKRINQRTGQPYGPIWRPTLAEQMQPEHLARHLATVDQWLSSYIPRSFDGVVCLDVESWPLKGDEFHMSKGHQDDLARRAPGKKQSELMAEFIRVTEARARELRPNVKAWGWWGMGSMHPAWPFWKPDQYAAWKRSDLEGDARALQNIQAPMPVFYFPTSFDTATQRAEGWELIKRNWIAMYGRERLSRDGYAYLNVTHDGGPRGGQPLTRQEFRECLEQARSLGMRRFVVWDAIDSVARRDATQKFIDTVLKPEVEALLAIEAKDQPRPSLATPSRDPDSAPPNPTPRD